MDKACFGCKISLPKEAFYVQKHHKDGRSSRCIKCISVQGKLRYRKNPAKSLEDSRRRQFGIDNKAYDKMFSNQGGKCGICGSDGSGYGRSNFCIDHDHSSGRVRGLLCVHCNLGLGHFKDDTEVLLKAVDYLRKR